MKLLLDLAAQFFKDIVMKLLLDFAAQFFKDIVMKFRESKCAYLQIERGQK